ncbi:MULTISPECIES: FAD-binding oxidoreductase [unclassified Cyanobium]|uniref:FAD-binding oxidoreductase n=1 Tax=unclassified Cyanobium TaxID=2627006 RepID=UPI0020CE48A0|nr:MULTISPECIES: FAD-binding oxidoreductase [unclassified Cyanobium]MCP9834037.1 FAD-binding oxidoreductase [Cyanobium sp. La Preciosa 7G6]MCP9936800.1 FAD-binding oxidoreductase [Cyanobium sp. Aljojuca 7A6]
MRPEPSELQELVRDLHRQGSAWLPAGLGSRLDWGPPLVGPCTVLSCAALKGVRDFNPGDFTITVAAGTPLVEVQEALEHHGQWLSVDAPWGDGDGAAAGSIGGLVARGLAGGYRQRYLGVRDQLIGLEVMRADGVTARAGGKVVKNVAGYDLMRLFSGSWGSLGLITELTLRTLPQPPLRRSVCFQGENGDLALLSRWLLNSSLSPERIDWWNDQLAGSAGLAPQPLLLIGLASVDAATLEEQVRCLQERSTLPARVLDATTTQAWLARARGGTATATAKAPAWLLRLGASPDRLETLMQAPALGGLAVDMAAGSGLGLAWSAPAGPQAALTSGQVSTLRSLCAELGGHLTVLRQPPGASLPAWLDAPSRPLIEAIKRRFDPAGQLAPGRLPGVAQSVSTL